MTAQQALIHKFCAVGWDRSVHSAPAKRQRGWHSNSTSHSDSGARSAALGYLQSEGFTGLDTGGLDLFLGPARLQDPDCLLQVGELIAV